MKTTAAVLRSIDAETHAGLQVEEVELALPGAGEVLVAVAYAGICHSDLSVVNGTRMRPLPLVLGHEASGTVLEVGDNVDDLAPGDHVVFSFVPPCGRCEWCAIGRPALCTPGNAANAAGTLLSGARRLSDSAGAPLSHHNGVSAFAQHLVASRASLVRIDPSIPLREAALFGCAVITGVGAVLNSADVTAGSGVTVFGLGGVGLSAVLGARAAGAYPIVAVDMVRAKLDLARELGATHVVDASSGDPVAAVRELTGGGTPVSIESVGSEKVLAQAYAATHVGGTTVTVGLPHPERHLSIPAISLVAEERVLRGSYMGSAVPQRDVPRYLDLYSAGRLPVDRLVTGMLGLDDVVAGMRALEDGSAVRQLIEF
jgi:alcohol dehydrogenase